MFNQSTVSAIEVEMVLEDLTVATSTQRQTAGTAASLFPQDLQATNNVVNMSLRVLIDDLESTTGSLIPFNTVSKINMHSCYQFLIAHYNYCSNW